MRPDPVRVGILILLAAFSAAFLGSFLVLSRFSDTFHLVTTIYGNPSVNADLAQHIALYGIIPIAACLGLGIAAFALERRFETDNSFSVPFFLLSVPCALWGIICLIGTANGYVGSVRMASSQYGGSINNYLVYIYELVGLVGVLWIGTGILLIVLARKSEAI